jgi:hypothetical protein
MSIYDIILHLWTVNLLQHIEHELGKEGFVNEPEIKRRAARLEVAWEQAKIQNSVLPQMVIMMQ